MLTLQWGVSGVEAAVRNQPQPQGSERHGKPLYVHRRREQCLQTGSWLTPQTQARLSRPTTDLDDVRQTMDGLSGEAAMKRGRYWQQCCKCHALGLREFEGEIESRLGPIEDAYATLASYKINVSKEESEQIDNLRFEHGGCTYLTLQIHLAQTSWPGAPDSEAPKREGLLQAYLRTDQSWPSSNPCSARNLRSPLQPLNWTLHSSKKSTTPRAPWSRAQNPGLQSNASIRSKGRAHPVQEWSHLFRLFEERDRKYQTYRAGEELFGLAVRFSPLIAHLIRPDNILSPKCLVYLWTSSFLPFSWPSTATFK